jgi:DNA-3-methyladenine glycosylase II
VDPVLADLARAHPVPFADRRRRRFEALATAILDQQISLRAAAAIRERLRRRLGGRIHAAGLLALDDDGFAGCGVSRPKRESLRDLSARHDDGRLRLASLHRRDDEAVVAHLTQVRGIGRWTAEIFLLFVLGRCDVLTADDLGLQAAAQTLYGLDERPGRADLERLAAPWRPWRSAASLYLWAHRDGRC